jgi:hypothetical protein
MKNGRVWPDDGACAFPCDPSQPPSRSPAIWDPDLAAGTAILETSDEAQDGLIPAGADIVVDRELDAGRHLVVDVARVRHRVLLRRNPASTTPAFSVPVLSGASLRLKATQSYAALLGLAASEKARAPYLLTAYRQRRLIQLLALLDAQTAGLSLRQIAFAIVFPRNQPLVGAVWKGSGERRHAHRLLGEAQRMCRHGYRTLLGKG